jgi:hypothetical protein
LVGGEASQGVEEVVKFLKAPEPTDHSRVGQRGGNALHASFTETDRAEATEESPTNLNDSEDEHIAGYTHGPISIGTVMNRPR